MITENQDVQIRVPVASTAAFDAAKLAGVAGWDSTKGVFVVCPSDGADFQEVGGGAGEPSLGNPGVGTWLLRAVDNVRSWVQLGALAFKAQINNTDVASSAAIAWTKIDKTGATAAQVGAAAASHTHNASDIDIGLIPIEHGGTGNTSIPNGFVVSAGMLDSIPLPEGHHLGTKLVPFYCVSNGGFVPLIIGSGFDVSSGTAPILSVAHQGGVVASGVYGGLGLEEQDICQFQVATNRDDMRIRGYSSVDGTHGVSSVCTIRIYDDAHKFLEKSFKAGEQFIIDVMLNDLNNAFITITTLWAGGSSIEHYQSLLSGFSFTGDIKVTGQGISDPVYNYVVLNSVTVK